MWSPPAQMAPGARWFCWIDPITYAFRAIIPPHFYCEGADCPTIPVVTPTGVTIQDRYTYIAGKYDIDYNNRWVSLGYLVCFIAVFQVLEMLATRYIRHLTR